MSSDCICRWFYCCWIFHLSFQTINESSGTCMDKNRTFMYFSYGFCHCKICVTKRMNLNVHHFNLLIFYWFIGNVQCTVKRRSVHHQHEMLNNSRKTLDSEFPKPFTASCGKLSILWCFLTLTKPLSVKTLYKRYTESVTVQDGVQWYRNSVAYYCRTNEAKTIIAI